MKNKGFTLIELMVTITIMMIMTSVVLFNYNRFNETTLLSTFAYDLSLTIRQAQVYGAGVRDSDLASQGSPISVGSIGNPSFKKAYGLHFEKTKTSFSIFLDGLENNGLPNGIHEVGSQNATDIDLDTYLFQRGINIQALCVGSGISENCDKTSLDVTFHRPDPEAIITANGEIANYSQATIILQSADTKISKSVIVNMTGQISVK